MKYFPQDIIENEEKFLEAFKILDNDEDRKQVLVQYYITNGNLPKDILRDFYEMWCIENGVDVPLKVSGVFNAKVNDVYFKIHYNRQDTLCLDVAYIFKEDSMPLEKEIYLNRKTYEISVYENIFHSKIII